jgi:predicted PurR-regulated permease PerM
MPGADGAPPSSAGRDDRGGDPRPLIIVDLDWRTVAVAIVAVLTLTGLFGLVRAAPRAFTWIVIGGLLALALNPLVGAVERRLHCRRGAAIAVVLIGFVIVLGAIALLLGPPAARQASKLRDEAPDVVRQLKDVPFVGKQLARNHVDRKIQEFIEDLPAKLGGDTAPIEHAARSIAGGALAALATVLVTISLLLDGERLVRGGRRVVPVQYRDRVDRVGDTFYRVVGKYFAGSLLVATIAGLAVLLVGLILGVPLTPLVAVWVALFDLVPQIGGAVGGVAFVGLALTQGVTIGLIALVFFVLYLQFENHILQPLIVGEAVDLSAPATMVAALIGVSAAGVPGALVAVPFLGTAKAIYLELRPPAEVHTRKPKRKRRLRLSFRRKPTATPDATAEAAGH